MARILIVEDEHTDRLLLASILEGAGHQVLVTSDGQQAFKTYLRMDPQVVVTDLQMPNVDGLELIDGVLGLYPDAPIIVVTGKGPKLLDEARAMGVFAAFTKPVDPDKLIESVEKALSKG